MGLDPNIWGPKGWFFLHSIALTYPPNPTDEDKKNYKVFFETLGGVLPCLDCQNHYKKNIKKLPIDDNLENNKKLNRWLVEIHNEVNKSTGKPLVNYNEYIENYKKIYENKTNYLYYIIIILFIIILFFIYYHINNLKLYINKYI